MTIEINEATLQEIFKYNDFIEEIGSIYGNSTKKYDQVFKAFYLNHSSEEFNNYTGSTSMSSHYFSSITKTSKPK